MTDIGLPPPGIPLKPKDIPPAPAPKDLPAPAMSEMQHHHIIADFLERSGQWITNEATVAESKRLTHNAAITQAMQVIRTNRKHRYCDAEVVLNYLSALLIKETP